MAHLFALNDEILSLIITLLVTSADGAIHLAQLTATCHKFHDLSRNPKVLEVVNFEEIDIEDYEDHHHFKDLLCLCARAGNPAAECMLGKALLHNDVFFWRIFLEHDHPRLVQNALATGVLRPRTLVRSFISEAGDLEIGRMRYPLSSYMITRLGVKVAFLSGILLAVSNMCSYHLEKCMNIEHDMSPMRGVNKGMAWLTPPSGIAHRARVLLIYDRLFAGSE